jgi:predicted permease
MRRFLLRLLALFRSTRAEAELAREIEAHLRLLQDDFIRRGMSPQHAHDAARRAFGGQVEQVKERQRDARSFRWMGESWLDLKLGVRMLVKYPGLTAIAVFALAVAIGGGAAYLEFVNDFFRPTLPVNSGERIVGITNWDMATGRPELQVLHDFAVWRESLTSVEHLGVYTGFERNLLTDDGRTEPVKGVEISASAFALMQTAPLLGRPLIADDERAGALDVVVLGYPLWQSRFDGDPGVVGRVIRLGDTTRTVVGVMPDGFAFPINHTLWVPLRNVGFQRHEGPQAVVFGRLVTGVRLETAQAELTGIAQRAVTPSLGSDQRLQPQIKPYVDSIWSSVRDGQMQKLILYSFNLFFIALLAVCGANVATLVFARTATREVEITLRTALGASRSRIVAQLFAEALVLASLALAVGLAAASFGSRWGKANWLAGAGEGAAAPFWWNDRLSPETLLYAGALALLAAVIVGTVPALKATGRHMQARLKHAGAGGHGLKFGGVWTGVIVAQIALTVLFLLSGVSLGWNYRASGNIQAETTFPPHEYLSVRLDMDRPGASALSADARARFSEKLGTTYQELEKRLLAEENVVGVTYATAFPGMKHSEFVIELQGMETPVPAGGGPLWVRSALVAPDFFATFGVPLIAGRSFTDTDIAFDRPVAIVDQAFVRHVLSDRHPVGQWVRQPATGDKDQPGPWYEIVGVVADLSKVDRKTSEDAVLYRPAAVGVSTPLHLGVHVRGGARPLGARVRPLGAPESAPLLPAWTQRFGFTTSSASIKSAKLID